MFILCVHYTYIYIIDTIKSQYIHILIKAGILIIMLLMIILILIIILIIIMYMYIYIYIYLFLPIVYCLITHYVRAEQTIQTVTYLLPVGAI